MSTFVDAFGSTVTVTGDGPFVATRGGVTVTGDTMDALTSAFSGMAPDGWVPPVVPVVLIAPEDMLNRFTPAEQQAIMTAAASNWQLSLWLTKFSAAEVIDVTTAQAQAGFALLVASGLLTQQRASQILTLTEASP